MICEYVTLQFADLVHFQWLLVTGFILGLSWTRFWLRRMQQLIPISVEAAVHALQQQQSGASAQLNNFRTRLDILKDRIGQRIVAAVAERDANVPHHTSRSRETFQGSISQLLIEWVFYLLASWEFPTEVHTSETSCLWAETMLLQMFTVLV